MLSLLVTPRKSGGLSKTWAQAISPNGTKTTLGLGSWPVVTLAMARDRALANARAIAEGRDVHLDYERYAEYPLEVEFAQPASQNRGTSRSEGARCGSRTTSGASSRSTSTSGSLGFQPRRTSTTSTDAPRWSGSSTIMDKYSDVQ